MLKTKKDLLNGICVVYFWYKDGSVVRSLCSANKDIVSENGIMWKSGQLYDLEVKKPIPAHLFKLRTEIRDANEDNACLEPLDQFAQDFIKRTWPF